MFVWLFTLLSLVVCYFSALDFKWSNIRQDSLRFRTGKFISYVWNRYVDGDFFFSTPFSQTVMITYGTDKIQYELTAKILAVEPLNDYDVNLKLLQWNKHEYWLKVNSAIKYYVDPYYQDFVSFKIPPKDMYKKFKPGMYIRIYTWRDVNAPINVGTIFTDWLQNSPVYKIMILKN